MLQILKNARNIFPEFNFYDILDVYCNEENYMWPNKSQELAQFISDNIHDSLNLNGEIRFLKLIRKSSFCDSYQITGQFLMLDVNSSESFDDAEVV